MTSAAHMGWLEEPRLLASACAQEDAPLKFPLNLKLNY